MRKKGGGGGGVVEAAVPGRCGAKWPSVAAPSDAIPRTAAKP